MKSETIATITLKDIAKAAGVSAGTVDRALHGRGGIKEETREKIRALANKMGYSPNRSARSLALRKGYRVRLVVLVNIWPYVEKGIRSYINAQDSLQIEVVSAIVSSPETEVTAILQKTLEERDVDGVLLCAAYSEETVILCDRLTDQGIPVVTFNSDLQGARRLGYVGQNLVEAGRLAACLLGNFIGREGKVVAINGFSSMLGHQQRLSGFLYELVHSFPRVEVVGITENRDSSEKSREIVKNMVSRYPNLSGVFVVAAGAAGAGTMLQELGLAGTVKMVCFDFFPETVQLLKEDAIQAIIGQDFFAQGYHSLRLLLDFLSMQRVPETETFFTSMDVGLSCNIDFLLARQHV